MEINDRALLDRSDAILARLVTLNTNIEDLTKYGRKNRKFIRWLAASLIFDVVLSLGLGTVALNARSASDHARQATSAAHVNAQNAHTTCVSGNESRKLNRELWQYVLSVPPSTPQTADQLKVRQQFQVYIDKTFAPRDCDVAAPVVKA